jgi:hypothetical protein
MQISLFPKKKSSFGTNIYLMQWLVGFNNSCTIANGWKTRQLKQASMPVRFSCAKLLVHPAAVSQLSNMLRVFVPKPVFVLQLPHPAILNFVTSNSKMN